MAASGSPSPAVPGIVGNHDLPLAWRVVWSMTTVAVDFVDPDTVSDTSTVSPDLTLAIPDSPPFTLVDELTVKVPSTSRRRSSP